MAFEQLDNESIRILRQMVREYLGQDRTPPRQELPYRDGRPGGFLAKVTAVAGSFPKWDYTVRRVVKYDSTLSGAARAVTDTTDLTAYNGFELVTGTAPYTHADGVTISNATDGNVNSGSCKIKSIGVGAVVYVTPISNATGDDVTYLFSVPNSAQ